MNDRLSRKNEVSFEAGLCMKMTRTGVGVLNALLSEIPDCAIVRRLTVLCALGRHTNQNLLTGDKSKFVSS
jgi:hypothetical protein